MFKTTEFWKVTKFDSNKNLVLKAIQIEAGKSLLKVFTFLIVQIRSVFWSVFSRIWTEYGDLRIKSPYSVGMRENTD